MAANETRTSPATISLRERFAAGIRRLVAALIALAIALLANPARTAHATAAFQLERITPREMYVAPGTSASYVLRISNVGDEVGIAPLFASFYWENRWDPYTLTQSADPRCGPLHPSSLDWFSQGTGFETAPIAPGEMLDCTMMINRPPGSPRDTSLTWVVRDTTPPNNSYTAQALIGTLADTSIKTRNLDFSIDASGIGHSTVELTVHNGSRAIIAAQNAGACEDKFPRPFVIDGSSPDGCGPSDYSPTCFDLGYGFRIPQLAAGQTHRCLIRLSSPQPYVAPLAFGISIDFMQAGATGGTLMDIDHSNNDALLLLGPTGGDAPAAVVAYNWLALLALAGLLVLLAIRQLGAAAHAD